MSDARTGLDPIPIDELGRDNTLLQSRFWALFKSRFGWRPTAFRLSDGATLLCLIRRVAGGYGIAYVPHGPASPGTTVVEKSILAETAGALAERIEDSADFIRFDPPSMVVDRDGRPRSPDAPFVRAVFDVQPPATVHVDLASSDETILAGMKPKTRYNVRLGLRRGVEVKRAGRRALDDWYEIYRVTAKRDRIVIHSREYYRTLFDVAETTPEVNVELLVAEVDGTMVAGNIVVGCAGVGLYLFGASSNEHRNLMPTYVLQWEGMRLCREWGCVRYDLGGIPSSDDESSSMHGLFRMKTGFGGRIVNRPGSWDYPIRPARYRSYRLAERLRTFYFKRVRRVGR